MKIAIWVISILFFLNILSEVYLVKNFIDFESQIISDEDEFTGALNSIQEEIDRVKKPIANYYVVGICQTK